MSGVAHLLEATITSALALKPSTVYVVCVENRASRSKWHLRKCFSEFAELREKVLALIERSASTTASSPFTAASNTASISSSYDTGGSCTSTSSSNSSDSSSLAPITSSCSEPTSAASSLCDRLPYVFKQFPRRQLFGSRSKKVIEQRTRALNLFVHQLLLYVREVKQQHHIAVYFSLMSYVEAFFECAEHATSVAANNFFNMHAFSLHSPSTLAKTQAAAAAAARAALVVVGAHGVERRPAPAPFSFSDDDDDEADENRSVCSNNDSDDEVARCNARPIALTSNNNNNKTVNVAQQFYREFGKTTAVATSNNNNASDDDDSESHLKKTASCIAHRELKEMKMHFTGSHYAPLQTVPDAYSSTGFSRSGGAAGRSTSPTSAWAARVEIAGISSAVAVRSDSRLPNHSKLAIGANRVQQYPHHPNHSSNRKKLQQQQPVDASLRWQSNENQHTQAASIVYARPNLQSSASSQSKSLEFAKHHQSKSQSSSRPLRQRVAGTAREERPEWM